MRCLTRRVTYWRSAPICNYFTGKFICGTFLCRNCGLRGQIWSRISYWSGHEDAAVLLPVFAINLRLSCYLVLLSVDSKTRLHDSHIFVTWLICRCQEPFFTLNDDCLKTIICMYQWILVTIGSVMICHQAIARVNDFFLSVSVKIKSKQTQKCFNPSDEETNIFRAWWRHQMETFSALLAICAGNSPVTGEFPAQRPVTRSFDVFFDLRLNKRLNKQSWGWWFEMPSRPLWRHCNG